MRQLSLNKRTPLALVAATESQMLGERFQMNSYVLDRSFYGWLAEVPQGSQQYFPPITTEDFVQVELATIREGHNHRRWPREVLEKFLAADVIGR